MARLIEIPYKPRNWAKKLHASFARFAAIVLHRRAGKTTAVVNHHLRAAIDDDWERRRLLHLRPSLTTKDIEELIHPPGGRHYGHIMPTRVQAKTVVWDKLKYYAEQVNGKANEAELLYRLPNGNKVQLFGADDPDKARGPLFSGLSFDEYSQQPSNIFSEVLSKALGDHLGYAIFLGTIKGKDHLHERYQAYRNNPDTFSLWQDIDTSLATEDGITIQLLEQAMADDRAEIAAGLMTQAEYDQEWYLSSDAAIKGAFYGEQLASLRKLGHITRVPYDPALPVDTDWDLGIDAMAVWFSQSLRSGEMRLIDYHEDLGGGLIECIRAMKGQAANPTNDPIVAARNQRRAQYIYGQHWAPHDIEVREISSGTTRRQTAAAHGLNFYVTPKLDVADGITAARALLSRCWFDEGFTEQGLEALRNYRKTYNSRLNEFTAIPVHNWASHGSDAFRGLAVRHTEPKEKKQREQKRAYAGAWS